jgi:hypothetical protein
MRQCHCGKDGHPLGSMNCPVHGYMPVPNEVMKRLLDALEGVIGAYDFCAADPADRGYSTLDSAISEARTALALVSEQQADGQEGRT